MNLAGIAIRGSSGLHVEVETFVSASYANITDNAIITDLNNLVTSLKNNGLWTPSRAIYPIVGGNANAHSYNLKDPTLYQIAWSGGITHNSNGITGNGSTGYGNTGLVPSSVLTASVHVSAYIRSSSAASWQYDIYCGHATGAKLGFVTQVSGGLIHALNNDEVLGGTIQAPGWVAITRNPSNVTATFKNNAKLSSYSPGEVTRPNVAMPLMASNYAGAISGYSAKNYAFFTIGDGLTDTQASNLYTAIQAFQTARGRQV